VGEYTVDARLAVLETLLPEKIRENRERTDLLFAGRDVALRLQYEITEKHLKELNGHNEETRKNLEITVSKDKFEGLIRGDISQLVKFMERTDTSNIDRDRKLGELLGEVKVLTGFKDNITGRMTMAAALGGLISSIVTAMIVKWLSS
jgi:hypothetical protein